jgi:hypothetical protein
VTESTISIVGGTPASAITGAATLATGDSLLKFCDATTVN